MAFISFKKIKSKKYRFFFKLANKGPMIYMTRPIISFDILLYFFKFYLNKKLGFPYSVNKDNVQHAFIMMKKN